MVISPKDKEVLDKLVVKVSGKALPVPVTDMLFSVLVEFDVILIIPLYDLTSVGEKVTVTVILFAGVIEAVVALKVNPSGVLIPVILTVRFPVFVIVKSSVLVVFMVISPKDKEELDNLIENISSIVGLSSPPEEQELNIKANDNKAKTIILFFMIKYIS